jgi:hypothetical protein
LHLRSLKFSETLVSQPTATWCDVITQKWKSESYVSMTA